jgi:hypothetical protein
MGFSASVRWVVNLLHVENGTAWELLRQPKALNYEL